ncbi:hypothetical protein Halru_2823 [Halovivax ruber XH-70]|uniref:Uncharacterized protein n=1 Tax=Halovivax ruber (strain DSM 18193 / JCM 13892 / XH-70) TaxID=797302 RepID=L0IF62_HALRX|nr:hypothetical protein [Halovivax ruber]AGB17394.1 hypothetical protein Halru_2823 [Halovivax ruber XH-70]
MTSVEQTYDGAGEDVHDRECYRCDRNVEPARLFRVTVEPPETMAVEYRDSERFCCPDCAAAMNLSEFSEEWIERRRQR